ncbi:histidinol-phosphatase [Desulfobotulus sp.]|jgi:histidinol-phosphatase (PHP family)|uniref:histidinol-phosphatase n=1 Tax=Desulfobotulus sp. TaxID=1940337 RepID=UPI002A366921|nr:histidinol-phosphatase [Desulfobotulus sp.]MDY0163281.1 histidinol-phosphatase [Desulfobotulus sp.]
MLDYHIHTPLCRHARGAPAAMVRAAVARGLREIAFLDHLTLPPLPGSHSMGPKDIPFYMNTIRDLAMAWEGTIRVLAGLEIDFHPQALPEIRRITETFDLDLVGGSVHFVLGHNIASRSARASWSHLPPASLYHAHMDALEDLVEADFCDVLCHLDLMEKFAPDLLPGERKAIENRMEAILDRIRDKDLAVEVNGSGLEQPMGEPYPSAVFLHGCAKRQIPLTLASDAHDPESVGAYSEALLHRIRRAGYDKVASFYRRRRSFIPLPRDPARTPGIQP